MVRLSSPSLGGLTRVSKLVTLVDIRMSRSRKSTAAQVDGAEPGPRTRADHLLPLAHAAADGDPEAAATLVAHVGRSMLAVVRRVLGRHNADVDDVTQDAVIALLGTLPTFRGECSVFHFAQRIALLTALTARRRANLRERWTSSSDALHDELPDNLSFEDPDTALCLRRRELVRDLLAGLPDVISESLGMHYVLGYTVDEIAAAAEVSPNTVWSRLRLGKNALRRRLDGDARLADLLEGNA
jgi:RNA polymerase sigma factor (sigma-70 family)